MLARQDVPLQDLQPGGIVVVEDALILGVARGQRHVLFERRLAHVDGALPLAVGVAELVPVTALEPGPPLVIGGRAIGEANDPTLQQVAVRVGLYVDGDVLILAQVPLAEGLVVVEAPAVPPRELGRARLGRSPGLAFRRLYFGGHRKLLQLVWLAR